LVTIPTLLILAGIFGFTLNSNGAANAVSSQVRPVFDSHLSSIESENTTLLMRDYLANASLVWDGTTRTLGGSYFGNTSISKFYSVLFSRITSISVKNATYKVLASGNGATVSSTFALLGGGPQVQSLNGEVLATVSYVHVNGRWVISTERWYFQSLSLQRPLG
jgi:hypothetical protein